MEEEEDVEYAPPPVKAKPYESDLVPAHLLTFKGLKRENMLKGYYEHYYQDFDENGMSVKERELEEQRRRALQKGEEQICQDTENMNWSVSDVPESNDYFKKRQGDKHAAEGMFETRSVSSVSKPKPVSLMAARKAAAALSMPSQSTASARAKTSKPRPPLSLANKTNVTFGFPGSKQPRKPTVSRMSSAELAPALAASRSTIGYNKGRSALGTFHARGTSSKTSSATANRPGGPHKARTISRSVSTASTRSDNTITPARFAQSQAVKEEDLKKLEFLSIFDVDEESSGDLGEIPPFDNLDEVFELQTNF